MQKERYKERTKEQTKKEGGRKKEEKYGTGKR
jgi:hypothetical protein